MRPLVLRKGDWRVGENLRPGTVIPAGVTSQWPVQNRLAMGSTGFIRYFQTPEEAEASKDMLVEGARRDPVRTIQAGEAAQAARSANERRAAQLALARQAKAEKAAAEKQAAQAVA